MLDFITKRRRPLLLSIALCGFFVLVVIGVWRLTPEPVSIAPVGKPGRGDRQVTFTITNSTTRDLTWICIVEVGGPEQWHSAARQPSIPKSAAKSGYRTLPAHGAHWLMVSAPEEGGTWRVRCVMIREQTAFEKRFTTILNKLRLARWHWSVASPGIESDSPGR
jgi:hypothetical protein